MPDAQPVDSLGGLPPAERAEARRRVRVLILTGLVGVQGGAHRGRLADHAEVEPRLRKVAGLQEQPADLSRRGADALLVGLVDAGGQLLRRPGGDGAHP